VLVRYEVTLWSALDRELGRRDQISLAELHGLRVLDRYDGRARVQELSADIGITVGAASKFVDRLERDGLAYRSPNPANRRSSLVTLTPAGRESLASATEVCREAMIRAIGAENLEPVTAALQRLQSRLDASGVGVAA